MFLVDWFVSLLKLLGLLSSVDGKIILVGLDNSGKTTLLYKLKNSCIQAHDPTTSVNKETIEVSSSCTITAIDVGGHPLARQLWKTYCLDVSGIVFMVDAKDRSRFIEAQMELAKLLNDAELENIPFVVLGNKIDNPNAVPDYILSDALGITGHRTGMTTGKDILGNKRPLELFMTSVINDFNITEALEWLVARMPQK